MGQHQPPQNHNDQLDPDRTQPSLTRPPRQLDWRPQDYQSGELDPEQPPPVPRRRPPTEGAPTWVVGLGVAALMAVIVVLGLLFVASRPPAQSEPTATAVIVTPTATLVPRLTFTAPPPATDTPVVEMPTATPPPPDTIAINGYVRVVAPSGLSFRDAASTDGAKLQVLDTGAVLLVVGGPQDSGGYTWWKLRKLDDGAEGWSAAKSGDDVFLEPASAP
ncbi:MAG: SH3 domain-containing protein [Anaerolineae bacterium]